MMRLKVNSKSSRKASPSPQLRCSYHWAAASSSSSASGWLTTRGMKAGADIAERFFDRLARDLAFGNFPRTAVNHFLPFHFSGRINFGFEAGNQFAVSYTHLRA